jgi:hypothetical protein
METTQGISLYSYLHLKLAKTLCFSYLLCFFFKKIGAQEGGTGSSQRWVAGGGGQNNAHVSKCKDNKIKF